jgi:hypothetical protein
MKILTKVDLQTTKQNQDVRFTHFKQRFNEDEIEMLKRFMLHKTERKAPQENYSVNFYNYIYKLQQNDFEIIEPIFEQINEIFNFVNDKFYNFDVLGISEVMSMNEMNKDSEVRWHWDLGGHIKLIGIIMLSDINEYEGGTLQFLTKDINDFTKDMSFGDIDNYSSDVQMEKGEVVVFPPYAYHAVTKVTSGNRKTLVFTMEGPGFK